MLGVIFIQVLVAEGSTSDLIDARSPLGIKQPAPGSEWQEGCGDTETHRCHVKRQLVCSLQLSAGNKLALLSKHGH